jgi:uncharacterized protein
VERVDKPASGKSLAGRLKSRLGIFAKEPVTGRVKTRLCPPLLPAQAARLYAQSLRETVARLQGLPLELVLFYSGDRCWFQQAFPGIRLLPQGSGDLGARMEDALAILLAEGESAALVGSDSPDLPPPLIMQALAALTACEVVTIPARDGGYVLIGERRHRAELFTGIPWSTDQVLAVTRRRALELGIAYREIGLWEDIDDLPSLHRLLERSPASSTARLAKELLAARPAMPQQS